MRSEESRNYSFLPIYEQWFCPALTSLSNLWLAAQKGLVNPTLMAELPQ